MEFLRIILAHFSSSPFWDVLIQIWNINVWKNITFYAVLFILCIFISWIQYFADFGQTTKSSNIQMHLGPFKNCPSHSWSHLTLCSSPEATTTANCEHEQGVRADGKEHGCKEFRITTFEYFRRVRKMVEPWNWSWPSVITWMITWKILSPAIAILYYSWDRECCREIPWKTLWCG